MHRGLFRVFSGYITVIVLLLLISITTISYTLIDLTSRDVVGGVMSYLLFSKSPAEAFTQLENQLASQCRGKSRIESPFIEGESMEIDCTKGSKIGFKQAFIDAFVNKIYYKNYECGLADCFPKYFSQMDSENPEKESDAAFFLLSNKMNSILKAVFVVLFIVTLAIALLAFLLLGARKIGGIFLSLGIVSIILPFFRQNLLAMVQNAPVDFANLIIERVSKISLISSAIFLPIGISFLLFSKFSIKKQQETGKRGAKGVKRGRK